MLVDLLSADLYLDLANKRRVGGYRRAWLGELKVHGADKVAVAADGARDLAPGGGSAVEGLLDALHGEVGVAAVDDLEVGDLRIAGKVNVLGAVGYKLHKSSSHIELVDTNALEKKLKTNNINKKRWQSTIS